MSTTRSTLVPPVLTAWSPSSLWAVKHSSAASTPGIPESFKVLIKELQSLSLDVRVLNSDGEEIDLKQHFDEDDDIPAANDDATLEEDQVMTTMDGFLLDEDQDEEGNMFDESSIYEDQDDMLDYDDFGSDEE